MAEMIQGQSPEQRPDDTYPSDWATARPWPTQLESTASTPSRHCAFVLMSGENVVRVDHLPAVWVMSKLHVTSVTDGQIAVARPVGDVDGFLDPLIQRIVDLIWLAAEDDEQEALRAESLEGFFRFLGIHREHIESRPQLVLTPDGYLRAVWRKGKAHRIALRFIDDKRVAFVTFLPDSFRPTQTNHIGGESSIEAVLDTIGQQTF